MPPIWPSQEGSEGSELPILSTMPLAQAFGEMSFAPKGTAAKMCVDADVDFAEVPTPKYGMQTGGVIMSELHAKLAMLEEQDDAGIPRATGTFRAETQLNASVRFAFDEMPAELPAPALVSSSLLQSLPRPPPGLWHQPHQQNQPRFMPPFLPPVLPMQPVPPPPVPEQAPSSAPPIGTQISIGSVGHPESCQEACKYVRRKEGCKIGARCLKCHCCFWKRPERDTRSSEQESGLPQVLESRGTAGHPHACARACKYVRRRVGCREGANCPDCHQCLWRRSGIKVSGEKEPFEDLQALADTMDVDSEEEDEEDEPVEAVPASNSNAFFAQEDGCAVTLSVGSIGHPSTCGFACKYIHKARGCKDGRFCVRCHLCAWRNNMRK